MNTPTKHYIIHSNISKYMHDYTCTCIYITAIFSGLDKCMNNEISKRVTIKKKEEKKKDEKRKMKKER